MASINIARIRLSLRCSPKDSQTMTTLSQKMWIMFQHTKETKVSRSKITQVQTIHSFKSVKKGSKYYVRLYTIGSFFFPEDRNTIRYNNFKPFLSNI